MALVRVLTLSLLAIPAWAYAVSFDCAKALKKVESLICKDAELSSLDDQLAVLYRAVKAHSDAVESLATAQRAWLDERNMCSERTCIVNAYRSRIAEIRSRITESGSAMLRHPSDKPLVHTRSPEDTHRWPYDLVPSYSGDDQTCRALFGKLFAISSCRTYDTICPDTLTQTYPTAGTVVVGAEHVENSFVVRSRPSPTGGRAALPEGIALVYFRNERGVRRSGVVETWKVERARIEDLGRPVAIERLLSGGERLSEDWSPLLEHEGRAYVVERECSGLWAYGLYVCNRIIKLTFKRVEVGRPSLPYCQLAMSSTRR